jgi:enoyl-CoA hydratase/carnithine racemase
MTYENLMVEIGNDFVAEITLNRPEQLNTFNTPLAGELVQAFEELDTQTTVRVIILKGRAKRFAPASTLTNLPAKPPWSTRPGSNTWRNRWLPSAA